MIGVNNMAMNLFERTSSNWVRYSEYEWKTAEEQRNFVTRFKAPDLELYTDTDGKLTEDLGIFTSPHTVLINTSGQEIGRIRGAAEWDDDKVVEYIRNLKEQHG